MSTYSPDFVNTVATIAVKASRYLGADYTVEDCLAFAWFSVNSVGDADEVDHDFGLHIREWMALDAEHKARQ